jgi:hypothetical protein
MRLLTLWLSLAILCTFTVALEAAPLAGQIMVDPENPRWLVRSGSQLPVFICGPGDPEGFLYRGALQPDGTRSGDQDALIETLRGTGANCMYIQAVRSHGGDGGPTENPFVDHDPSLALNDALLDQWETWFDSLDALGVVIYLFLYDDGSILWTGDSVGQPERDFVYGIVDRFEHHRNLIWCVAEEYSEGMSTTRAANVAAEIRAADDHDHVIAVHQRHGLSFDFPNDPNVDQFAIQYNVATAQALHSGMVSAWQAAAGRYQLNMSESSSFTGGADSRKKSWACAMGGAYVMIYQMDIASTPLSDLQDCGRLVRFFEGTRVNRLAPHDELAFGSTQWVLAEPGTEYVAYTSARSGDLGIRSLAAGDYDFRWMDCATGTEVNQTNVAVAAGDRTFATPAGLGSEVAVSLRRGSSVAVESESWAGIKAKYRNP